MTRRKLAPFVALFVSLVALEGCASTTTAAVGSTTAPHPVIGFATPAKDAAAEPAPRFESERMIPRPMTLSGSWAR
jgi:hypothetical protein